MYLSKNLKSKNFLWFRFVLLIFIAFYIYEANANSSLYNFNEPNLIHIKNKLHAMTHSKSNHHVLSITQLGDSHTAADLFTGELRLLLQQKYGDAGIGWITPLSIKGQRHALVSWENNGFDIHANSAKFLAKSPIGGYIAEPLKLASSIIISTKKETDHKEWLVKIAVKPLAERSTVTLIDSNNKIQKITLKKNNKSDHWQIKPIKLSLPFKIVANQNDVLIGDFWLQKYYKKGVIVSPIGSNGAKLSIWNNWHPSWINELKATQSQLIIIAYGSNEAFMDNFDANLYRNQLLNSIKLIRQNLPKSAILLMTPPDNLSAKSDNKNQIPPNYDVIKKILFDVAKQQKTLLWDWQKAMGGACSIQKWLAVDLAKPDLIHLSKLGYEKSAQFFYNEFMQLLNQ